MALVARVRSRRLAARMAEAPTQPGRAPVAEDAPGFFTESRSGTRSPSGPPHDPLTLALAITETFRLAEASASACTALPAHAIAFPPSDVT